MRGLLTLCGLVTLLGLLGCQTTLGISGTEAPPTVCTVWKIVRLSHADTAETIAQTKANNAARRSLCGDG